MRGAVAGLGEWQGAGATGGDAEVCGAVDHGLPTAGEGDFGDRGGFCEGAGEIRWTNAGTGKAWGDAGEGGGEGESVTKYFLTFRNSIIRSGKIEEIKDAIAKIFRDGKDDLGRYLENAVKEVSGGGLAGGKLLTAEDIAVWSKKLMDEFGTKLEKVDGFSDGETLASFNSNTNTVKYMDGVTEYMMAHEYYHAQEMFALGFNKFVKNAPLLGTPVANYTKNNWIHRFLRERYVYDKLYENRALHGLNEAEIQHAYDYISYIALELIYRKIPLPK